MFIVLVRLVLFLLVVVLVIAAIVAVVIVVSRGFRTSAAPPQPGSVPPGWYPQQDGSQRYWNGAAWTEDVHPPTRPSA